MLFHFTFQGKWQVLKNYIAIHQAHLLNDFEHTPLKLASPMGKTESQHKSINKGCSQFSVFCVRFNILSKIPKSHGADFPSHCLFSTDKQARGLFLVACCFESSMLLLQNNLSTTASSTKSRQRRKHVWIQTIPRTLDPSATTLRAMIAPLRIPYGFRTST